MNLKEKIEIAVLIVGILIGAFIIHADLKGILAFRIAKYKANAKSLATGRRIRYYVLPINGRLRVLSTRQLARINRKLPKAHRLSIDKLLKDAYYYTK